jgi:nucleoside phosphorylase/ActR/RegA family two-component response regulator
MKKILMIENSQIFREKVKKILTRQGYSVELLTKCDSPIDLTLREDIDLMLLDLNLGEDALIHGEGILEILKDKVNFPIIVLTAYDDRIAQLSQYNVYTVLEKPIETNLLLFHIQRAFKIKELNNFINLNSPKVDFAIVTALYDDEFESVLEVFDLSPDKKYQLGGKNIFSGKLESFPEKKIIATYQSEVGKTDASNLVTDIIKEFNPRYIFMTGVCGGNDQTSFGDVIIAKFVFTFDKGKITDSGFLREIELVKINESILRKIRENNKKTLVIVKERIKKTIKSDILNHFDLEKLKAIIDPMACSSAVIDKENYFKEVISSIERKATAVEMESYGFARAAETTNYGLTQSAIIKSVMDNTSKKNDKAKSYASYTSAIYLKSLLELGVLE